VQLRLYCFKVHSLLLRMLLSAALRTRSLAEAANCCVGGWRCERHPGVQLLCQGSKVTEATNVTEAFNVMCLCSTSNSY
jgi:hypothetical protein